MLSSNGKGVNELRVACAEGKNRLKHVRDAEQSTGFCANVPHFFLKGARRKPSYSRSWEFDAEIEFAWVHLIGPKIFHASCNQLG